MESARLGDVCDERTPLLPKPGRDPDKSLSNRISPILVNNGNVARDHLALERTYLGYLRTSLAVAAVGVSLVQLFIVPAEAQVQPTPFRSFDNEKKRKNMSTSYVLTSPDAASTRTALDNFARPLGATALCLALMLLFIGATRFFSVQNSLVEGKFPLARGMTASIAVGVLVLVVSTLVCVLL
ncbi:hypothetical protein CYLTODRAFT_92578 [Cylindrobasidium torrendii FP15055 ss-10]|uniref:DUF202 domain-containing protein n=1 Tax=Cylindrobasidium torrendii FP15055 ss-10 TaxID=1314674 RepID=A0A0D7BUH3_9AGAR|nr:hypothetical protein CYLTODRAFT_92578 [Cylindrobasidium torrendii FP15055 ss-10]